MKLHFLALALLCLNHLSAAESIWEKNPTNLRKEANASMMSIDAPVPEVFSVENLEVENRDRQTPIRIYTPNEQANLPVIMLIHGGGWFAGNLDTHDNLARYLSSQVGAVVVSVGYTNSPEGKFPMQLEQSYDTLLWIKNNGEKYKWDTSRLAIVGDSVGGGMAAAVAMIDRDRGGPKLSMQVLINPVTDLTCGGTMNRCNDENDPLRLSAYFLLNDRKEALNPFVSPVLATDLKNLPPAFVILSEKDHLLPMGQKYADHLKTAGIPTTVYIQQGVGHLSGDGARASLKARDSLDRAVLELRKALGTEKHEEEDEELGS